MKRAVWLLTAVVGVVILAGCGGGGGGGATPAIPLDGVLRQMQAGDQWTYSITGTVTDGVDTVNVSGTMAQTWSAQTVLTPNSATANIVLWNMSLSGNGQTIATWDRSYESQDSTGTIWEYGGEDEDGVYWVITPATGKDLDTPSPMSQGTSWGGYCQYSNGESVNAAYTVVGQETIAVSAGSFGTYKVTGNGLFGGYPATVTEWYAPQIGGMVKGNMLATDSIQGITMTLTITLQSKSRSVHLVQAETKEGGDLMEWARRVIGKP